MFDHECLTLAQHFLGPADPLQRKLELAQHIQNEVEAWMEDAAEVDADAAESYFEARRRQA